MIKHQIPITKQLPITNDRITKRLVIDYWNLEFIWLLVLGDWLFRIAE